MTPVDVAFYAILAWPAAGLFAWFIAQMRWGFGPDYEEDIAIIPHFMLIGPLAFNSLWNNWWDEE